MNEEVDVVSGDEIEHIVYIHTCLCAPKFITPVARKLQICCMRFVVADMEKIAVVPSQQPVSVDQEKGH
jgi:hypothetical protein